MSLVDQHGRHYPNTAAFLAEAELLSRQNHPERYAPDGSPLAKYRGRNWDERLEDWRRRQPKEEPKPEPTNTWSDEGTQPE